MRRRIFGSAAMGLLVMSLFYIYFSSGNSLNPGAGHGRLYRISDGARVTLNGALSDLEKARLIFVGEVHDKESHHEAQLEVIRALAETGASIAIGLEMFERENQGHLDQWIAGDLSEEEFVRFYYRNWTLPWPLYRDIFLYAREQGIPMIGLNVPREIVRQVGREGFGSLTPEQRAELPPVVCIVDEAYKDFIRRALGLHGHGEMDFTHFCEAQLLWDNTMAVHLLNYLQEHPDRTVVTLAGRGHAWKPGIPRQIENRSKVPYIVILPEVPGTAEKETVTTDDADYLWLIASHSSDGRQE